MIDRRAGVISISGNIADDGSNVLSVSEVVTDGKSIVIHILGNMTDEKSNVLSVAEVVIDGKSIVIHILGNMTDEKSNVSSVAEIVSDAGSHVISMAGNVSDDGWLAGSRAASPQAFYFKFAVQVLARSLADWLLCLCHKSIGLSLLANVIDLSQIFEPFWILRVATSQSL